MNKSVVEAPIALPVEPAVIADLATQLGLLPAEYAKIQTILGRTPTFTELGIFSVMWSEHCSYKNSITQLKTLPREGENMAAKAGEENAGAITIGDNLAVVFKIESHNHPSAVEPYQGAATGVGGIHRDIFTMGARPIASLNSLRFGPPTDPRSRRLLDGVVRGIGDYGNCFGVPTVGGEVFFADCYRGNPLVNAMSVGIVKLDKMASAVAKGDGNPVMIVGSKTGRDGIHGATFASVELSAKSESQRSSVQVGDPFMEKLLLEATLEIIDQDLIVGIQDMGAAGITCSCSEMSARGECGIEIDIEKVPVREGGMTPYEILLSESQERMLVCVKKGNEDRVRAIFSKWGLDGEIIGHVTNSGRFVVRYHGQVVSDIPSQSLVLGGGAPIYTRETARPAYLDEVAQFDGATLSLERDWNATLLEMMAAPNITSKRWVYNQYDSTVRASTAVGPGSDAAVVRLRKSKKALALVTDCNARYCYLDPREGAKIAVAEAARNIVCTGGKPQAITNCLNFGNPYKPEVYYTFVEVIAGMGEACRAFHTPVTGGNVSFYNEDPARCVFPTPVIGMVGIIEDHAHITTSEFKGDGDIIYLLGETHNEIGGSEYLSAIHGLTTGLPPRCDLAVEMRLHETIYEAIGEGIVRSAHDLSDGGLAVALAESCVVDRENPHGATITIPTSLRADVFMFGESQSRAIVSVRPENAARFEEIAQRNQQIFLRAGVVGGSELRINGLVALALAHLSCAYHDTLPRLAEAVL